MDKTVLITGGSRGIGAAAARIFAQAGCRVAINCYTHEQEARTLADELAPQAWVYRADVSSQEQVREMFAQVKRRMGPVDILVNNAGIAWDGLLTDMRLEEWERVFAVNVRGIFLCCREVLPDMVSRQTGCIVNVSSMWGQVGASCEVAYSASKAAVIGMTQALAKEVAPSGIRVNCVAPGVVDTDMMAGYTPEDVEDLNQRTPLGRMAVPQEVARAVFFLAGEGASFVTGEVLKVNGGFVV